MRPACAAFITVVFLCLAKVTPSVAHELTVGDSNWKCDPAPCMCPSMPFGSRSGMHKAITLHAKAEGDFYEFGVYKGDGIRAFRHWFGPEQKIWGFDSFAGLPPDSLDRFHISNFKPGDFAFSNLNQILKLFPRDEEKKKLYPNNTELIHGYYNESLTAGLARERGMRPARFVHIDCDLYSSTADALEWMYTSGLLQVGTLLLYDDWWNIPCSKGAAPSLSPLDTGEGRAHAEFAKRYGLRFTCVAGGCVVRECSFYVNGDWMPSFRIEHIGGAKEGERGNYDTGFDISNVSQWKMSSAKCRKHESESSILPEPVGAQFEPG